LVASFPHRRGLLQGLAGAAIATRAQADAITGADPSFVVIGDWGRDGHMHQSDVARVMGAAAAESNSLFTVSTGDNFYPAGVKSVTDPQWKSSFEDVYDARSLQSPWYVALGNHDYRGSARAQVHYSRTSARWRMPDNYFKVSGAEHGIPHLDIFVLDTTPFMKGFGERFMALINGRVVKAEAAQQVAWFEQSLASSKAPWKVVVGHHPVYSGGHHGDTPELIDRVQPLLEKHGVQAYINGHDHVLQHIRRGPVDYICSGSGASAGHARQVDGSRFQASRAGFAMFAVGQEALSLEFRDFTGASLYRASLPRSRG
jgi:tartrate-resistant acid phosphatase type 5